jgi:hypothetical protein
MTETVSFVIEEGNEDRCKIMKGLPSYLPLMY